MATLGARSITAVYWGAGGTALRMLIQIGAQVVLARLLGPAEYGVFAVGGIVVGFCTFFADFGLAYGLIQKREVSDADIRFAFTWQMLIGLLVSLLISALSARIAMFFGEPRAEPVVAALAWICLINALTGVPLSLLKRNLDFKTQQAAFLVSYVVGFVLTGIPMALCGWGVWSLVSAWMVQALCFLIVVYRTTRHPFRPLWWYHEARTQVMYSRTVVVTNIFNWGIANVDKVSVGHQLSSREMGLYSTIYNLVYVPVASILSVVQPVFFSASSRVAESTDEDAVQAKLRSGFAALIAVVCLYILPACLIAAVLAEKIVLSLYGQAWRDGAVVLRPVALAMPFFLAWGLSTPMLWASGKPQAEFGSQWHIGFVWAVACWVLAATGGIAAVAWGGVVLFAMRCAMTLRAVTRCASIGWGDLWRAARGGAQLALLTALCTAALSRGLDATGLATLPNLMLSLVGALLIYYLGLRLMPQLVAPEAANLMSAVLGRLPARVAGRLGWLRGA